MEIIQTIADFLGVSSGMLIFLSVAGVFLVGLWAILRFIIKLAWKIMVPGCLLVILVLGGLYMIGWFSYSIP